MIYDSTDNRLHGRIDSLLRSGKRVVSNCLGRVGEITRVDPLWVTIKPRRAGKNGKTRYATKFFTGDDVLVYVNGHGWTVKDSAARLRMAFGK